MRVYAFLLEDYLRGEQKCPECNWEVEVGYVLARNENEAKEELKERNFLCGNCMIDLIKKRGYIVSGEFDSDDYPDMYFPNWFTKDHFELFLGKSLTDEEFYQLKESLESDSSIADRISEIVREYLEDLEG